MILDLLHSLLLLFAEIALGLIFIILDESFGLIETYKDKSDERCENKVLHIFRDALLDFLLFYLQDVVKGLTAKPVSFVDLLFPQVLHYLEETFLSHPAIDVLSTFIS